MTRGRGEGTFGRTPDGGWWYRVSLGVGPDGKRIRRRVYGRTKADALDAAARLRRSGGVSTSRDRLGDYLDHWLDGLILAPGSVSKYRDTVRTHIAPALGRSRLSDLHPEHVRQWQRDMVADGKSPSTANYARVVLRIALAQAVRDELIERNVVELVRPLKVERRARSPLTGPESVRFIEAVGDSRLGPLFTTAIGLGLRFGELRGLYWSDVEDGVVHVQRQIPTGSLDVRPLKTGQSGRRLITLPGFVSDAISRERTMQLEERLRAGRRWGDGPDLIFRTPYGRALHPPTVRLALADALDEARLPSIHFHDLRHSTATLLLTLGVDMRTVQTILGHSAMRTTEAYAHVMPELTADAMARLDALLGRSGQRSGQR